METDLDPDDRYRLEMFVAHHLRELMRGVDKSIGLYERAEKFFGHPLSPGDMERVADLLGSAQLFIAYSEATDMVAEYVKQARIALIAVEGRVPPTTRSSRSG
jgi:hypothetical protein